MTDELDLDYGEEFDDPAADAPEVKVVDYSIRSTPKYRDPDMDWPAYFRGIREAREARGVFDAGGQSYVLEAGRCSQEDLPAAARRLVKPLLEQGWDVRCQRTLVEVAPLLYAGDSDAHSKGDLRTPDHERTYWGVQGALVRSAGRVAWFWATWVRAEVPGRKAGNTFESVVAWDAATGQWPSAKAGDLTDWLAILARTV